MRRKRKCGKKILAVITSVAIMCVTMDVQILASEADVLEVNGG